MSKPKRNNGNHKGRVVSGLVISSSVVRDVPIIKFSPPTEDTPGCLRYLRDAMRLRERVKDTATIDSVFMDDTVAFLLPFVTFPEDRAAATDALLDMSRRQYEAMFNAVIGAGEGAAKENAAPPLASSEA